ncbi:beta-glucuronosyltransferase GlcAT14A [Ananas comosus]|uniref:Beta-glucuronosyltransferase GlcAT14A n=1 Tax=Ananas comosus TaxID=4615 RepID=A0A6P5FAL0_ANACO|nr:beta-glucuronosyltransferase GlcAT14A [Ananas comosus]XP_020093251.1 beta-glucuronosyltransferase GlcAT14A [Ananas comosus]
MHSTPPHPPPPHPQSFPHNSPKDPRGHPLLCVLLLSLLSLLLLLLSLSSPHSPPPPSSSSSDAAASAAAAAAGVAEIPSIAYLISGRSGDGDRILRLLLAAYHPGNLYLLHLDRAAPRAQRERLARAARAALRGGARNVHVVGEPDFANPRGASALAAALHGAAVLLRLSPRWGWFVNLDASDYPLVTQDDLLHVFSFLPKDLNFIQHSSYIGWRESRRIRPIIVDPGLYLSTRADVFYATQKRELPDAYKLFTGDSSVILSRKFIEYCILGTNNLPRTLLMYYSNMPSPHLNYFHTVLCNSPEFNRTVVNHNLHYVTWDMSSRKEPRLLTLDDVANLTRSGVAFATQFAKDDPALDRIDQEILGRGPGRVVPGGWCLGGGRGDPCSKWGSPNVLRPGRRAMDLANAIAQLLTPENLYSHQCIWD